MTPTKEALRQTYRERRDAVDTFSKQAWDTDLYHQLIALEAYQNAQVICCYAGTSSEPDTEAILKHALQAGKTVAVPRVVSKREGMKAIQINTLDALSPGAWGIPEPQLWEPELSPESMDLVIVPGLVFDTRGYRIGYGGGFYDRFLLGVSEQTATVSLVYPFQMRTEPLPVDDFDIPVKHCLLAQEKSTT